MYSYVSRILGHSCMKVEQSFYSVFSQIFLHTLLLILRVMYTL
jgi:hypothetical protein